MLEKKNKVRKLTISMFVVIGILIGIYNASLNLENVMGSGEGFGGEIKLEVVFNAKKIEAINIISHNETLKIARPVFEGMVTEIIEKQNLRVDNVVGATYTSKAIKEAVYRASEKNGVILERDIEKKIEVIKKKFLKESFVGIGEGFYGEIKVEVIKEDGKISKIKLLKYEDTETIFLPAVKKIEKEIVKSQNIDVDLVAGATFSSEGYIEAVKNSLKKQ